MTFYSKLFRSIFLPAALLMLRPEASALEPPLPTEEETEEFEGFESSPEAIFRHTFPFMNGWGAAVSDTTAQSPEAGPFFALPLTSQDKSNIRILLTDLSEKNYLQLLMDKANMNRKGDRVRAVHPMRFIGHVLSDPSLHKCLKIIEKDPIIYREFVLGFQSHMEEEAAKEDLTVYAPGFAELLETDPEFVVNILNTGKYEDLIKKFI